MRKNLLFILLLFLFMQDIAAQEHMKFMGIPIDGTLSEFGSKLIGKGFVKDREDGNIFSFKGQFTGADVDVLVLGSEKSLITCKVMVFFNKETAWRSLKSMFNSYKKMFIEKYGEPSNDFHFFSKPYYEGDGYEMQALRLEKCTYSTYWHISEGSINLDMGKSGSISIGYEDYTNMAIRKQEKQERNLNDI